MDHQALLHRNRRLVTVLGLGTSAAALSGIVHLQSVWAHADAEPDSAIAMNEAGVDEAAEASTARTESRAEPVAEAAGGTEESVVAPSTPPLVAVAQPLGDAAIEAKANPDLDAGAEPVVPEAPALITVPDLSGMKVGAAVKTLKGLGLRVSIQDEYGDRVYVEDWQAYKVRKQRIEPGTKVEPGSRVRLDAKYRRRLAKGY